MARLAVLFFCIYICWNQLKKKVYIFTEQYNQNDFKNKIITMNNPYMHHKNSSIHSRRTLSIVKKDKSDNRSIATANLRVPCLDHQFLHSRKQNYLNARYNNRRQRLQDITQQNRKIYVKINTQKSAYSRDQHRKSYQQNSSISRRLSESKVSRRMSSRQSLRSSKIQKHKLQKCKPKQSYFFQPHSLTHIKATQLQNFTKIFKNEAQNIRPQQILIKKQRNKSLSSKQTICYISQKQISLKLPSINPKKIVKKSQNLKSALGLRNNNDGTLLHIIAEEMFGKPKQKF